MENWTASQIGEALKRLGRYRVTRAQMVGAEGAPDRVSGVLLLSMGMRETGCRNIEGGAKKVDGQWVPLDPSDSTDARRMDVGWIQINRGWHRNFLTTIPAVRTGTWGPVVQGVSPYDAGFVPRFEESIQFAINGLREAMAYAEDIGVDDRDIQRFGIAAHNAGWGGARDGWKAGDIDKFTAGGDYSAWVLNHRKLVQRWINDHPNWKVPGAS